jgi:hypothetical protein
LDNSRRLPQGVSCRLTGPVALLIRVYGLFVSGCSSLAQDEKIPQIETILGVEDDPKLPASSLDAILVADAFHEFENASRMPAGFYRALKPSGR